MGSVLDITLLNGTEVRVRGEVDLDTVGELRDFLDQLDGSGPVVIEAAGTQFMDSSGLNLLLELASRGRIGAPGVIIRNPSRPVRRLFEVALPSGMPGLELDFSGGGPGAAHRLTQLMRSTFDLRRAVASEWAHGASTRDAARRARIEHAGLHLRLRFVVAAHGAGERTPDGSAGMSGRVPV